MDMKQVRSQVFAGLITAAIGGMVAVLGAAAWEGLTQGLTNGALVRLLGGATGGDLSRLETAIVDGCGSSS